MREMRTKVIRRKIIISEMTRCQMKMVWMQEAIEEWKGRTRDKTG